MIWLSRRVRSTWSASACGSVGQWANFFAMREYIRGRPACQLVVLKRGSRCVNWKPAPTGERSEPAVTARAKRVRPYRGALAPRPLPRAKRAAPTEARSAPAPTGERSEPPFRGPTSSPAWCSPSAGGGRRRAPRAGGRPDAHRDRRHRPIAELGGEVRLLARAHALEEVVHVRMSATRERLHRRSSVLGAGLLDEVVLVLAVGHDLHLGVAEALAVLRRP